MATLVITDDGSHSIRSDAGVTYHSMHGALRESNHVFIRHGLAHVADQRVSIDILEIGFGTGLNALLSYQFALSFPNKHISYFGIELHSLPQEIYSQLNYPAVLDAPALGNILTQMHTTAHFRKENFVFTRIEGDALQVLPNPGAFDCVFLDAFAPGDQPELWSVSFLSDIYTSLRTGGVLTTYCAQGQFKRDLKSAGFLVESLEGPPGKREMVRAIKSA